MSTPDAPSRGGHRARGGPAALLFATMFPQTALSMLSLAPPVMAGAVARDYGLPTEIAGAYSGLVYAFVLLGNLAAAPLIQRFGPLRLSFACVAGGALGLALFGVAGVPGLLAGAVLIGLCYGPLTPASSQAMAHQAGSPSFVLIVSIRQTSVPLGGVLAGFVVPPLLPRLGWGETCVALAVGSLAAALVFAAASPLVRAERPAGGSFRGRRILDPLRLIFHRPALLRLALASAIFGATQLVLSAFLVVYLVGSVGHDLVTAGVLLSASQIAGILGRPAWGYVADRTQASRRVLVGLSLCMAGSCLFAAALAAVGPSPLSMLAAVVFGATATGWNGVFLAEIMGAVAPAEVGAATSGGLLFTYGGIVVGPALFGALAHAAGFPAAFAVLALCTLGAAVLVGAGSGPRRAAG
ncbi:MFS transporter [Methylobacterium sp. NEAU 140]|uniref:MFS transporter n=1 Tax=Methylobacterium sp. NEAU 140 TaxID=3064945 RepID=UPI0027328E90|nr:MFS transporter [Methylobacterium sp. NEAU 140]MDP4023676.1 MFS transporter [Methylobacterium sp. NEAU 140]